MRDIARFLTLLSATKPDWSEADCIVAWRQQTRTDTGIASIEFGLDDLLPMAGTPNRKLYGPTENRDDLACAWADRIQDMPASTFGAKLRGGEVSI